ncbi:hypothetical protein H7J88_19400 [Mycolicibacterium flavescens]|uniref:Uncharacterized protein n=1 Tax=Mycolicibacterium flavescens TaxID=1776 RepID=A0A1E3RLQ6_MYCFV|nr:hypothetical protein [Mycolicibacterium flavescens]MCV7281799.1 hypothetical protein [Mycolicibacterium flavescens]ODQ90816.1 hypothetical protein BHQ18_08820 [Mycolicibacterium flavescens]
MELRWWVLIAAGLLCLAVGVAAAWLTPVERVARRLRPLAHVNRLTRLPEFARVQRIYLITMAATAGLLLIVFLSAIVAAARPVQLASANDGYDAAHPRDVMLCVGQPITDPTTADFLNYYAEQAKSFTNEQVGVTSTSLRVMPMTRDNVFIEQRLRYFASMAQIQQQIDTRRDVPLEERLELAGGVEEFGRTVNYVDYATSLEDVLALCLSGFPDLDKASDHRRQLVYLGYSRLRSAEDTRPALFSADQVQGMAQRGGVQINAISRADVAETSEEGNDDLRALAEATGGRFTLYNPAGTAGGTSQVLSASLDEITDNSPAAASLGVSEDTPRYFDRPQFPLAVAVIAAALLSVALVVLRR